MTNKIKDFFAKREWLVILILVLAFILIRLPGTGLPLHQDEYKWPGSVDPSNPSNFIPHPPVGAFIYRNAGYIVGFDADFRFVPLFFGTLNLLLLYYFMRFVFGRKEAVAAGLIWTFSYFSVLASLMVDTDGQIMPFFFLLSLIGYFKLSRTSGSRKYWWGALFLFGLVCGILIKLSFAIAIGAFVCDFLWSKKHLLTKKDVLRYGLYTLSAMAILAVFLLIARYIFPFFDLDRSLKYWEHFIVFDRGWFQTFIQCAKALLYSSPFLVLVPFFAKKEDFAKVKIFYFFLGLAFIFYIILFDFSIGALDRYLQLLILPLTVFVSIGVVDILKQKNKRSLEFFLLGCIVAGIIILLQSVPHYIPSLHPKSEWISRIFSLRWNFVYPFSGGSGPLGFYISFLFMILIWIAFFVGVVITKFKSSTKKLVLLFLLPLGIAYNGFFIEEYLFGNVNGHAPDLISHAVEFIRNDPNIQKVIVYNDNGAEEVRTTGKYFRRLYADPAFTESYKEIFSKFNGHILYIDIPRVDPNSIYKKYFDSCVPVYNETDLKITATILDCRKAQVF